MRIDEVAEEIKRKFSVPVYGFSKKTGVIWIGGEIEDYQHIADYIEEKYGYFVRYYLG